MKPPRWALELSIQRSHLLFLPRDDWYLFRLFLGGAKDTDAYVKALSEPGALTPALNWYRANLPPDRLLGPAPPLPPVAAPTMGVFGTADLYLNEEAMVNSASKVTGPWRYERLEGVGHFVPLQAADQLNKLLLDFLPTR